MSKKVTIRDIAREAGVSIATVSYVLNNREDQSISEATRQKILQVVNLHQYRINFTAKCISSGKTNIITLFIDDNKFALSKAETMLLTERLQRYVCNKGYSLQLAFGKEASSYSNSDAIICHNLNSAFFRELGELNFCPLIALDMIIPDNELFFQVYTDYGKIKSIADKIYGENNYKTVSPVLNCEQLKQKLLSTFNDVIIADNFDFANQITNCNAVVLGEMLGKYSKRFAKDVLIIDTINHEKLEKLWQCLEIALSREEVADHDIKV